MRKIYGALTTPSAEATRGGMTKGNSAKSSSAKGSPGKNNTAKGNPSEGFTPGATFYDMKKFPRGFNKYGEFTKEEAHILHSYGRVLLALEKGEKKPANKHEKQFLSVCRGERSAETVIEKAWVKYLDRLNRKPKVVNPFGSSTQVNEGDSMVVPEDLEDDSLEDD
jgi:uncharacterized protein YifE (UPF0438 family)